MFFFCDLAVLLIEEFEKLDTVAIPLTVLKNEMRDRK